MRSYGLRSADLDDHTDCARYSRMAYSVRLAPDAGRIREKPVLRVGVLRAKIPKN